MSNTVKYLYRCIKCDIYWVRYKLELFVKTYPASKCKYCGRLEYPRHWSQQ